MVQACGTNKRNNINNKRGSTYLVSHIGELIPKPIAAIIKFRPSKYKAQYSKRPPIKSNPQISSVEQVNQHAETVRNFGMPLFANPDSKVAITFFNLTLKTASYP